jgi:general secretion pathway protein F
MQTATLDDFIAFNEQIAALVDAGVPLDVGLSQLDKPAAKELERINATVVRRVNRGETLAEALDDGDQNMPAAYCSMVQLGLQSGDLSAALDGSGRVAESIDESRFTLELALIYPLIVGILAYVGLIGFSLFLVPTLEGMHETMRVAPGRGLRVLQLVRDTLPYWIAIPPVTLVVLFAHWRRAESQRTTAGLEARTFMRWLPGVRRIVFQERAARFAGSLAELLDNQAALSDALAIAGDSSGDAGLRVGAKLLADATRQDQWPADDSSIALRFPPFLRWAIWHSEATTGRVRALQIAEQIYDETSRRHGERLRTVAPMIALVLLGGTVTLLYCLALFVPMVEMLHALAKS